MNLLLFAATILTTLPALSAPCPQLSGIYEYVVPSEGVYTMTFKQLRCSALAIHYFKKGNDGSVKEWDKKYIADGVFREGNKTADFVTSSAGYFTVDQFVDSSVTYQIREGQWKVITDLVTFSLNPSGNVKNTMTSRWGDGSLRWSNSYILTRKN